MTTRLPQHRRGHGLRLATCVTAGTLLTGLGLACDPGDDLDDLDDRSAELSEDALVADELPGDAFFEDERLEDALLADEFDRATRTEFDHDAFERLSADPDELQAALLAAQTVGEVLAILPPDLVPDELWEQDPSDLIAIGPGDNGASHGLVGASELASGNGPMQIGEAACATAALGGNHGAAVTPATGVATSPNHFYNPPGCPRQFITEVSPTSGQSFDIVAEFASPPTTQATCSNKIVEVTSYGRRWTPFGPVWDTIQTTQLAYVWVPWYHLPGKCVLMPQNGFQPDFSNTPYHRIRTAAQAYVVATNHLGGTFKSYKRVTAGIEL